MATTNTTSKYTYSLFAMEVMGIVKGEIEVTPAIAERVCAKATDLLNTQESKRAYNATHPKKNANKGASADTLAKAEAIKSVLSSTPMTGAEINAKLDTNYTALQIANATKFIEGVTTSKVIRSTVNQKGLRSDREYTAYAIG